LNEMPWVKSYPEAVRWNAELTPEPVAQILDGTADRYPDHPAIDYMTQKLSYRQLKQLTDRAALGLQQLGVGPGVHVGLYLPTGTHYVISFFAVLKAGGTVVNYSPMDAERELAHKIDDSQTTLMVTMDSQAFLPQMARLLETTQIRKLIVGRLSDLGIEDSAPARAPHDSRHATFASLLDNRGDYTRHPLEDLTSEIAVLQYTGGTTGLPKAAMLTHANLTVTCKQFVETAKARPVNVVLEGQERMLVVLPMFHIYALTANMLFGLLTGTELILHSRFDPQRVLNELVAKRVSIFMGVPTMFTAFVSAAGVDRADLTSLKLCMSAGAPLPSEILARFEQLTCCRLCEGWGMTETSPAGTFTPLTGARKPGSCGLPMPGVTLKFASIEDPAVYVSQGERGEICISGPNVMKGYWRNPEATRESFTADGFFRTGDVGTMDDDGYVYIVDRTKDMLLCSGFNVYPRVIEEAIYQHPSIAECCVIGIPDAYRGQSPKAFVVQKPGAEPLSLAQLQAFLAPLLGKYEMVHALEIRAELPKTSVGKLSKKMLQEAEARHAGTETTDRIHLSRN
jgi:long-chain acyl-CoA synthetase